MSTLATDLAGVTKTIFDTKFREILPSDGRHPFTAKHKMQSEKGAGKDYRSTLRLAFPGGTSFSNGTAITFEGNLAQKSIEMETSTRTRFHHERLILDDLFRAAKKGPGSYLNLAVDTMAGLLRVAMDYNEVNALEGQMPFAVTLNTSTGNVTGSGTSRSVVFDAAQFIPLAFAAKKVAVDAFSFDNSTGNYAKLNTNAAVIVDSYRISLSSGSYVVTGEISGNSTDMTAIDSFINGSDTADLVQYRPVGTTTVVSNALVIAEAPGMSKVSLLQAGDVYAGYTIPTGSILIGGAQVGSGAFDLTELENGLLSRKAMGAVASKGSPWILMAHDGIIADLYAEARSASSLIRVEASGKNNAATLGVQVEMIQTAAGPVKLESCDAVRMGRPIAYLSTDNVQRVGTREAKPAYDAMDGKGFTRVPGTNNVEFVAASQVALHHTNPLEVVSWSGNSI